MNSIQTLRIWLIKQAIDDEEVASPNSLKFKPVLSFKKPSVNQRVDLFAKKLTEEQLWDQRIQKGHEYLALLIKRIKQPPIKDSPIKQEIEEKV